MGRERNHGQIPCSSDEKVADKWQSYQWLKFGDTKGETRSTLVAAQEQELSTNCFKKILKKKLKANGDCVNKTKNLLTT
jgi:hypothetical protein